GERHGRDDLCTDLRVDANLLEFFLRQRTRLRQDVLGDRQLADVVQERRRLHALDLRLGQARRPREAGGVDLHATDVHLRGLILRIDRTGQRFDRRQVQIGGLLHVALLVLDAAHVDLVGAVGEVERRKGERRNPVARVRDEPGRNRGGARADEIARRAPEEVVVPGRYDGRARRQRDRRRDETGVQQEVDGRRADERLRELRERHRRRVAAEQLEAEAGALHRDEQRRDAEERPVQRVALLAVEHALAVRAAGGDEHRL